MIIKVRDFVDTTFVGSRFSGEKIRVLIEDVLQKENKIFLDFEDIENVTQSFADEVIGILIRAYGFDLIKEKIKLINANEKIRLIFNWVANYSKKTGQTLYKIVQNSGSINV